MSLYEFVPNFMRKNEKMHFAVGFMLFLRIFGPFCGVPKCPDSNLGFERKGE